MWLLKLIYFVSNVMAHSLDGPSRRGSSRSFIGSIYNTPRGGGDILNGDNNSTDFSIRSDDDSIKVETEGSRTVKEKKKKGKTTSVKQTGNTVLDDSIRRIRREWKDVVLLGVGYDWVKSETVIVKRRRSSIRRDSGTDSSLIKNRDLEPNNSTHRILKDSNGKVSNSNGEFSTQREVDDIRIGPLGKSLFTWHFSVGGAPGSSFAGGIYHGRVILPKNYPGSPPRVQVLTPSGRFIVGHDICLSASNYHPESWTPRWTVLSLVQALRMHMLTAANEIGGIESSHSKRKKYAMESRSWKYPGIVNHSHMIASGDFADYNDETSSSSNMKLPNDSAEVDEDSEILLDELSSMTTDSKRSSVDVSIALPNSKQHTSALKAFYKAIVSVATNPIQLSLLILFTLFTILNKGG